MPSSNGGDEVDMPSDESDNGDAEDVNNENGLVEDDEEMAEVEGDEQNSEPVADDAAEKLAGHSKDVFCLSVSNSSRWLASGSGLCSALRGMAFVMSGQIVKRGLSLEDDTAAVWDLGGDNPRSEAYLRIADHSDSVTCLAFNSSSLLLASGDMAGRIILTELEGKCERCRIDEGVELEWLRWHPTTDILFAGTTQGQIWMWLITAAGVSQSKVFPIGESCACTAGVMLNDPRRLLAGYGDGQVRVWNLKEGNAITMGVCAASCCCLATHPSLEIAAVGGMDGSVSLMNTANAKVLWQTKIASDEKDGESSDEGNSVEVIRFAPDYPWLAAGTSSGMLAIYDIESGTLRYSCHHDGMAVVGCLWVKIGGELCLTSACIDGAVRAWNARNGEPAKLMSGGGEETYDICEVDWLGKKRIVTACANGIIRVFDTD